VRQLTMRRKQHEPRTEGAKMNGRPTD